MTLMLSLFLACKDQATLDENARLQQRVEDLQRTTDRLQKDNDALKAQLADAKKASAPPAPEIKASKVTFKTSLGDIHCTFRPTDAPETVANFVGLATGTKDWTDPKTKQPMHGKPLYDGTTFHRVIPEFMIQGGDPLGNGTGGPGYKFADEISEHNHFDKPGLLAMANAGPNTNGSQFFITEGMPSYLDKKHTIFGDCEDLDVVKKIARVQKDGDDKPLDPVVIKKVVIE